MSSLCNRCEQNDYLYEFSYNLARFQEAESNCRDKRKSLASNLDKETLMNFNECCSNAPGHQYYIGLVARSNGQCNLNSSGQFQWVDSNTCTDGNPLNTLHAQPNSTCQAVLITLHADENALPTSTVVDCNTEQHYICQIKINLDVSPTISPAPTFKIPAITSSSKTASSLYPSETSASSTIKNSTEMTFGKTVSSFSTSVSSSSAALNPALIAGIVIGIIAIILVIALASLCCFKKMYLIKVQRNKSNKQPISLSSKDTTKNNFELERNNSQHKG